LTPFEEFLLWEDRRSYPWSVFLKLRFHGRLDRGTLELALTRALDRHPLLRSKIEIRRGRRVWVAGEPTPPVCWHEIPGIPRDDFPRAPQMDLTVESGLRVHVFAGPDQSDVVLQVHHACCDGAGLDSFMNDLLILYASLRESGAAPWPLPAYDPQRLADRGRYGLTWLKLLGLLPRQLVGLQGAAQFLLRKPTPITPHIARPDHDEPPPGYPAGVHYRCTIEETTQLRVIARQQEATTNDVLARDLFLTLIQCRREWECDNKRDWLRMMVPMNLRSLDDRGLPAANVVSCVFLDRRDEDASDPARLLRSIHDEMQLIKRNRLGLTFLFSLRFCQWLPGGLKKAARNDKCTISCTFTNVGKMLQQSPLPVRDGNRLVGDLVLDDIQAIVPVRPYSCATFCTLQYAGRQAFDLHYDPGVVRADQAQRMMDLFVGRMRESLANRPVDATEALNPQTQARTKPAQRA
jgi:hypothetical protein